MTVKVGARFPCTVVVTVPPAETTVADSAVAMFVVPARFFAVDDHAERVTDVGGADTVGARCRVGHVGARRAGRIAALPLIAERLHAAGPRPGRRRQLLAGLRRTRDLRIGGAHRRFRRGHQVGHARVRGGLTVGIHSRDGDAHGVIDVTRCELVGLGGRTAYVCAPRASRVALLPLVGERGRGVAPGSVAGGDGMALLRITRYRRGRGALWRGRRVLRMRRQSRPR